MIVNLTPHPITQEGFEPIPPRLGPDGKPNPARVAETVTPDGTFDGRPAVTVQRGRVEGLPAPEDGSLYLVSEIVVDAARSEGRTIEDLCSPYTGPGPLGPIRFTAEDEAAGLAEPGQIAAVRFLRRYVAAPVEAAV